MARERKGAFFIHLADPGFPNPPFPGARRLGPYNTVEEALAQAVADAAQGAGVALGIYDEEASETHDALPKMKTDSKGAPVLDAAGYQVELKIKPAGAIYTQSEIRRRGEAEAKRRKKLEANEALGQNERDAALQAILGDAVKVEELRDLGLIR